MPTQAAPGFVNMTDVFNQRVLTIGWNVVNDAVEESTRLHTEALDELIEEFVVDVDQPKEKVSLPVQSELQPLQGDHDNPKPEYGTSSYEAGYPLWDAGWAWGTDRKARVKMTVGEASEATNIGLRADAKWNIRRILAAVLTKTEYTFKDPKWGDLVVKPLANGDAVEYIDLDGNFATDNHYLFQAAGIADATNPFPTIFTELTEHPENSGDPIVYTSTSLLASIKALAAFVPYSDPDITPAISSAVLTGARPNVRLGDKLIGKVDECWIYEWRRMPAGYMVATCEGSGPFVGRRQEEEPELRGLRPEFHSPDGNHYISRVLRTAGYGVRNRIAALAMQIGAGAYTTPPAFANILPI